MVCLAAGLPESRAARACHEPLPKPLPVLYVRAPSGGCRLPAASCCCTRCGMSPSVTVCLVASASGVSLGPAKPTARSNLALQTFNQAMLKTQMPSLTWQWPWFPALFEDLWPRNDRAGRLLPPRHPHLFGRQQRGSGWRPDLIDQHARIGAQSCCCVQAAIHQKQLRHGASPTRCSTLEPSSR